MRYTLIALGGVLALGAACREPTSVVVDITTDIPCSHVHAVSVTAGSTNIAAESASPLAVAAACDNGRVGSITLVPAGNDDGPLAIKVALGVDRSAESCTSATAYDGCVVARRQLAYRPHTSLRVPVFLGAGCQSMGCDLVSTCSMQNGARACVDAHDTTQSPPGVDEPGADASSKSPNTTGTSSSSGSTGPIAPPSDGALVEDGLVMHLDAAHASDAHGPQAHGCNLNDALWYDRTTHENDGTLYGFNACNAGSGWNGDGSTTNPFRLTFDGTNDSVSAPLWLQGMGIASVGAWINTRASGGTIMGSGTGMYDRALSVYPTSNRWRVFTGTGVAQMSAAVPVGTWTYAVVTYGVATTTLYVDGAPVFTTPSQRATSLQSSVVQLGRTSTNTSLPATGDTKYFDGDIADVHIYARELTAAEVHANCTALRGRFVNAQCK